MRDRLLALGDNVWKYSPHNIFVDVDAKIPRDFQGDSGGAKLGVSSFHLQDKLDEFW